ncbi:ABC transporter ATP-binding protein [Lamprobacter modestohalophilus]|uniref:ABC transporter ATP-binding protein n=1 Tax=Lamprobacter modestohalophilus TaxID=1064514 RepID=UPI002ADEE83E|nr:ABC transporter ATP-binding protein [Lamprobacter modestohalophilus]MEA1049458.1 ABC transporter ATP-binding protein [Lamprobacter modestohalophilus]
MSKLRGDARQPVRILVPDFRAAPGEFVAVLGENGSGKSTFLDMLGLILSPGRLGEYSLCLEGQRIALGHLSRKARARMRRAYFGYALQTGGLLDYLTLRQNVAFAADLHGGSLVRVNELADLLGLADVMHKHPAKVSGGQRQKAALLRVLVQEPPVVLADEPTAAIDSQSATKLVELFSHLIRRAGSTVIMVTHQRPLIDKIADSVYEFRVHRGANGEVMSALEPRHA